jgi:PPM family protein phosphatase
MKITFQAVTDVGRKRKGNEDNHFVNPEPHLLVVADGMGGHAAGEMATRS